VDTKYEIPIEQMIRAPTDWTIREYEEQGLINTKHYLVNMPDLSVKQTLCVMPDTNERPTMWDEIANKRFFIINGQHNVAASKDMQTTGLPESIVKNFRKWNCFIVWSKDRADCTRSLDTTTGATTLASSNPLGLLTFWEQDSSGRS
jgi:hypothetical protein